MIPTGKSKGKSLRPWSLVLQWERVWEEGGERRREGERERDR